MSERYTFSVHNTAKCKPYVQVMFTRLFIYMIFCVHNMWFKLFGIIFLFRRQSRADKWWSTYRWARNFPASFPCDHAYSGDPYLGIFGAWQPDICVHHILRRLWCRETGIAMIVFEPFPHQLKIKYMKNTLFELLSATHKQFSHILTR